MKRKIGINPDRAIKDLRGFYFALSIVFSLLALLVTMMVKTPERDLFNATALVLEVGFAIAITWTVYLYSKKWKVQNDNAMKAIENVAKKLEELTKDIQDAVKEDKRIRDEIRYDFSYHLNGKLKTVITTLTSSLQMYDNYINNKDGKRDIWKPVVYSSFNRTQHYLNMQINLLDLMRIFGTGPARQYSNLLTNLQVTSEIYGKDDYDIAEFVGYVRESLEQANELKTTIAPFLTRPE